MTCRTARRTMGRMVSISNGQSFSNGQSMNTRAMESWLFRLQRPVQDRGNV